MNEVIQYVSTATAPEDYVLQWGDFPMIKHGLGSYGAQPVFLY